jgi:phospholipid/cholesterol/gamma-HCH transport system ATP-binding protein
MVTHDKDTIEHVLDRFIILGNKKVLFDGTMAMLRNTKDESLKTFLN